jgi:hypothetical protein
LLLVTRQIKEGRVKSEGRRERKNYYYRCENVEGNSTQKLKEAESGRRREIKKKKRKKRSKLLVFFCIKAKKETLCQRGRIARPLR